MEYIVRLFIILQPVEKVVEIVRDMQSKQINKDDLSAIAHLAYLEHKPGEFSNENRNVQYLIYHSLFHVAIYSCQSKVGESNSEWRKKRNYQYICYNFLIG